MTNIKSRQTNIEILRIIASVMVVLLHTVAMGAIFPGEKGFVLNSVLNAITRFSVPVFVMISGYFILGKEEDYIYFFKRGIKLIVIMMLWSLLYLIRYSLSGTLAINTVKDLLRYLLTEPVHLWYFYALFALTIFTPALGLFARKADKKTYIYTMTLMLIFGSIITMIVKENLYPSLVMITDKLKIGTVLTFPCYYLFGYYVKRFGIGKKFSWVSFSAGLLLTIAGVIILSYRKGILSENVLSFYALNVAFMSMGIFGIFASFNIGENRFVKLVSPLTAGIYGLHLVILPSVYEKLGALKVEILQIFLSVIITFTACGIVAFVYRFLKDKLTK